MEEFTPNFKAGQTNLNDYESGEDVKLTPGSNREASQEAQPQASAEPGLPETDKELKQEEQPEPKLPPKGLWTRILFFPGGRKPLYRRYWVWVGLGLSGGLIALGNWGWQTLERSLPDTDAVYNFVRDETLTIKASDGTILKQRGPATREQLQLDQIPKPLIQAFIASEDQRFYQHHGVDYQGIFRALISNLQARNVVEGGSTITQQLTRIVFFNQERSLWRKLKEARMAQKVEDKLNKGQIIERYLNLVYLGGGAYGVADAAWVYFSKPVDKLTLPEMATIAGLAPAPSRYSPLVNPEAARQRRNVVLQRMQDAGFIKPQEATAASQAPLALKTSPPKHLLVDAPYFSSYIEQELPKYLSQKVLHAGGLTVDTTVNLDWQKVAEKTIKETVENDGPGENFKQAALVAIDPRNGEIKALVGGKDFNTNNFNHATQAQRQPGSTFKGFVYATAIATGKSPYDTYEDAPFWVDGYEPKNFSKKYRGNLDMRDALTYSINVIAVKVLIDVGFEPTIKLAHDMGIKSPLSPTYSLALGGYEVNLLELTSAYGTLATQGAHTEVHGIRRILDRHGKVLWAAHYQPKQVLDKNSAAIMTWMLRNVVQEGTGRAAQLDDRPVAGKTGTSDEARDLWFIGYIPQLVAGVWLGNDNNHPTWGMSGTAAATWHEFIVKATKGMPKENFPKLPKLEDRKGSIKAKPVKPRKIRYGKVAPDGTQIDPDKAASGDNANNDDSSTRNKKSDQEQDGDNTSRRHSHRNRD